jgi:hypothetical protein
MKELDERIERAVGSRPVRYEQRPGGYSTADRFAVTLDDGRSVFVKSADAPNMAEWLRREHEVYAALAGSFIPALEGWRSWPTEVRWVRSSPACGLLSPGSHRPRRRRRCATCSGNSSPLRSTGSTATFSRQRF